jgi:hypothetical protein
MEVATANIFETARLFSYEEYKKNVRDLLDRGLVTGDTQSEVLLQNTDMNLERLQRNEKRLKLDPEVIEKTALLRDKWTWYVITEGWCGDASQILPYINAIAKTSPHIELKLLLRDENPVIMDRYLTNGTRSVPKMVVVHKESGMELGTWGPRPKNIQDKLDEFRRENPEINKRSFARTLHFLYAKDRGEAIQSEFKKALDDWLSPSYALFI